MVIRHMGGGGTVVRVLLMLLLSVVEGRHIGNIYIYEATRYEKGQFNECQGGRRNN